MWRIGGQKKPHLKCYLICFVSNKHFSFALLFCIYETILVTDYSDRAVCLSIAPNQSQIQWKKLPIAGRIRHSDSVPACIHSTDNVDIQTSQRNTTATTADMVTAKKKRYIQCACTNPSKRALDVSKQFFGAGMIHFINLGISYYASKPTSGPTTNLCVWYFLNVGIDTTFGVLLLWCWFTLLMNACERFQLFHVGETGDYGPPPLSRMIWPWMRQMSVFLLAEILIKACLYEIVINSPWLFWLGELCISWTQYDPKIQVVFVMLM